MSARPILGYDRGVRLSHPGDGPLMTVSRTGGGKSLRVAVPNLVEFPGSMVVVDLQDGQLTRRTALYRSEIFGHRIEIVDPGQVVDPKWLPNNVKHGCIDLIDYMRRSKLPLSDGMAVAQALIPTGTLKDSHWAKGGAGTFTKTTMFVAFDPLFEGLGLPRNMASAWALLSDPGLEKSSLKLMAMSDNKFVADYANAFLKAGKDNNEMPGLRNQIRVSISEIFNEPAFLECLTGTNLDFPRMRREPTTLYLVLPGKIAKTHAPLLKAILTMAFGDIESAGLLPYDPSRPRFIWQIDEAAALGSFPLFLDLLARGRGFAIIPHLFLQNLGQLRANFGDAGVASIMGNIELVQFFAGTTCDYTATALSKLCGTDTRVERDVSYSSAPGSSGSTHYKTYGRQNMMIDEIMHLPLPQQLLIRAGKPPVKGMVFDPTLSQFPIYRTFMAWIEAGWDAQRARAEALKVVGMPANKDAPKRAAGGLWRR